MSGDIEGTKRVRDALDFTLKPVLDGFVEANMKARHGGRWLHYASRSTGKEPNDPLDVYGLLKTVLDNWQRGVRRQVRPQGDTQGASACSRRRSMRATPSPISTCP